MGADGASGSRRSGWGPRDMPAVRDEVVAGFRRSAERVERLLADPRRSRAEAALDPVCVGDAEALVRLARGLRVADLFWVSEQMTRLALDASGDLPAWTPSLTAPSTHGLLVWDQGLPELTWSGAPARPGLRTALGAPAPPPAAAVRAISWAPASGGVRLAVYAAVEDLREHLAPPYRGDRLFNAWEVSLPDGRADDVRPGTPYAGLAAAVGATWLLMTQPTVASTDVLAPDRATAAAHARARRPDPVVRLVDLRRHDHDRDPDEDAGAPTRTYRHRWVVRGHWRQQPHGPDRAQRRPTWIPPHLKGPDGAPLLSAEHVHVWRR